MHRNRYQVIRYIMINELCDMFSLSFIIKIVYNPFTRNEVLTLSSFLFLVNWIDKHKKKKTTKLWHCLQ